MDWSKHVLPRLPWRPCPPGRAVSEAPGPPHQPCLVYGRRVPGGCQKWALQLPGPLPSCKVLTALEIRHHFVAPKWHSQLTFKLHFRRAKWCCLLICTAPLRTSEVLPALMVQLHLARPKWCLSMFGTWDVQSGPSLSCTPLQHPRCPEWARTYANATWGLPSAITLEGVALCSCQVHLT